MKCKMIECQENMVVAGPPNDRCRGLCWRHAVALSDALTVVNPAKIMKVTGIIPCSPNEVKQINQELKKHLGNVTLSRLGRF